MKRLRIWLKELTLSQQLLTIIFMVISIFSIFFFVYLSENINDFVKNQMYKILHRTQDTIAINYRENRELMQDSDADIQHILFKSEGSYELLGNENITQEFISEILTKADKLVLPQEDHVFQSGKRQYYYSMKQLDNSTVLISLMSDAYRSEFKNALLNSVININVLVVGILFVILMIWVSSLIHPLNQIRAYIDKIRKGENYKLKIDRRDEIGEVAEALVAMEKELLQQDQIKEEMIQNISHDLKTPIATIKSYGESIKDGIYPYETLEKSVDVIIEHAERLEKKVYSLIMLNKMGYLMDSGDDKETVDMSEVIEKVILSLKVIRPELEITTDLDRVYFHGEEEPWRIVVENLLDNAIRYAKTYIHIDLDESFLSVFNDGNQMTQDRLEKLFRPYEKGTDGKFGLGLSIVYRVVSTYGYHVEAENLNEGVAFRIYKTKTKK